MNGSPFVFICPRCKSRLEISDDRCSFCNLPMSIDSFGTLWVNGANFPDHDHKRALKAFESGDYDYYSHDEQINTRFINEFSVPLLASLYHNPQSSAVRVLSVGCGVGIDVDILRSLGYDAWGTDCGSRCLFWSKRQCADHLVRCIDDDFPFPENFFDFVMCHQVLEHIGVIDDSMNLQPNYKARRKQFLANLLRMTKPEGYLNVATPNRLFPLDPGHSPNFMGVRIHGPFDHFLTSYSDMAKYFTGNQLTPLSPMKYYTGTSVAARGILGKVFGGYLMLLDRTPSLRGTFLNPLTNVLVQKAAC